jgi:hypothetical protein
VKYIYISRSMQYIGARSYEYLKCSQHVTVYQIIPHFKTFTEQFSIAQMIIKMTCFLQNWGCNYCAQKCQLVDHIRSSFTPVYTLIPRVIYVIINPSISNSVAQLVEALRYKPERRGFDSRWYH